jgi:hypothetical protein
MNVLEPLRKIFMLGTLCLFVFAAASAEAQKQKPKANAPIVAKGILHSIEDGIIIIESQLTSKDADQLRQVGFSMIDNEKEIASGTILKNRLFMGYSLGPNGPKLNELKIRIGKPVSLTMKRLSSRALIVTGMK